MGELMGKLRNKKIIAILDGDKDFGYYNEVKIQMPYLSGSDICGICQTFGFDIYYDAANPLSRWVYMDELIDTSIKQNRDEELLAYLFAKDKFEKVLNRIEVEEVDATYEYVVNRIIEEINKILYFGGYELLSLNTRFCIGKIGHKIDIEAPNIKTIDRDYIKGLRDRASKDIMDTNYDSAITKCRTLVEEIFIYVIELKNEEASTNGDIKELYNHVKKLYSMHQVKENDKRVNMLLSGLEKIITSIALMRNNEGDCHGAGKNRYNVDEHHARLYLNASVMISEFILEVANKNKK